MVETAAPDPEPLKAAGWTALSDEKLLDVRMCDLELSIEGTDLEQRIAQLNTELDARAIAEKAMMIAGEICIYTNANVVLEEL